MEGFVVTKKPTTPKDTKGQGDTNTQYNRQTTSLHSSSLWRSHTSGCRRHAVGMQFFVGCGIARLYFSQIPPNFGNCGHARVPFFLNGFILFYSFLLYLCFYIPSCFFLLSILRLRDCTQRKLALSLHRAVVGPFLCGRDLLSARPLVLPKLCLTRTLRRWWEANTAP